MILVNKPNINTFFKRANLSGPTSPIFRCTASTLRRFIASITLSILLLSTNLESNQILKIVFSISE
ncbi:hypothetical protein KBD45_01415 [Candidatus Dojkabacteria bacterium]|jgi:hypothetical protein|nr:hypothetical protein [Candidatus Dojkabacteria bacterium]